MRLFFLYSLLFAAISCSNSGEEKSVVHAISAPDPLSGRQEAPAGQIHTIVVRDVIQVSKYTYILAGESAMEYWLAAPSMVVKTGDTLYYQNGVEMKDFESKELNRKFEKILFVDKIFKSPDQKAGTPPVAELPPGHVPVQPKNSSGDEKLETATRIEPPVNGTPLSEILKNPSAFNGKKVIVRGKITKYTAGVMKKNWVHLQDGTSFKGKAEIVITTTSNLSLGDIVTFEGLISLNKDLGFGYFFEVLMEDAIVLR